MKHPKKKILFLTPSFNPGGAEKVILRLLRDLDRSIAEYHLGVIWNTGPLREDISEKVIVHNLNVRRTRYMFIPLVKLISSLKPQIVFTSLSRLNLGILALKALIPKDIKVIIREPSIPSISLFQHSMSNIYVYGYRKLYPKADKIVCQSEYMKRDLENNFLINPVRIKTIYNPVPLNEIKRFIAGTISPFQTNLNIVACGRLTYVKGFDVLIQAFSYLSNKINNIKLTILGDGPMKKDLEKLTKSLNISNKVSMPGFIKKPYSYFKYADLYVSSSRWEGLPNVILEALACGTPVVATDCPGGTAEIVKNGINGWLAPSEDPENLASCILAALRKADKIRGTLTVNSIEHLSSKIIIPQYERLFVELLEKC